MSTEGASDGLLRIVLIILAVIILFPVLMMALAVPMIGMMGWWGGGIVGGLSPMWVLGVMLVWFVVLGGIGYLLYRGLVGGVGSSIPTDRAVQELRLAYARDDLTDEEFEERRTKLRREESQ